MSTSQWRIEKTEAVGRGMVVADDPRAAEAGAAILRAGGNAVDAAVAAALVMGVVEPWTSGVGGVAALLVYLPRERRTVVVDGSGLAPRRARADMFELLEAGNAGMYRWPATRDNEQHEGPRSIGVPGAVACFCHALERYGRIGRAAVLAPAIRYAEEDQPVGWYFAAATAFYAERLWKNAEAARIFFRPSRAPRRPDLGLEPGDHLAQPELARTLRLIAEHGAEPFYRGALARSIVDDIRALGGLLEADDLAAYQARELEPLASTYRDLEVRTLTGASGGITLIEALNVLEGFMLRGLDPQGAELLHLLAEASRLAFLDRFAYAADPDAATASLTSLAGKERAEELRGRIDRERAHPELEASPLALAPADTTQVSVVDGEGMAVSLTATLGQAYGSGVVARGTGVVLADVLTWFDPRPGRANSIAPGKRILWAIAPTIVLREGRPWLVLGAPGGRRLITAILQALVHLADHDLGPQRAVNGVRVHCEGGATLLDSRANAAVRERLAAMGHRLEIAEENLVSHHFGRASAIRVESDRTLRAGVHRLKQSTAVGV
jgi:gamma-glutamyltranspeptidase/glutathione hydrolase